MTTKQIDGQQVMQDDQMSNCWSFGSNYHPSSQSRKMSIGIRIDSFAKIGPGGVKDDDIAMKNAENTTSYRERKNKEKGPAVPITSTQNEAPAQEKSPWIQTKSIYKKKPSTKTFYTKQNSSLQISRGRENKVSGAKQDSVLHSGKANKKKFNSITDKNSGGKNGTTEMEKLPSSAGKGVCVPGKGETVDKLNKTENRTSAALKMKLWEVLGNVSSPNKQFFSGSKNVQMDVTSSKLEPNFDRKGNTSSSNKQFFPGSKTVQMDASSSKVEPNFDKKGNVSLPNKQVFSSSKTVQMDANSSKVELNFDKKSATIVKPRQNSDTIEPDSESPHSATRRPVTRSLTRRRAPNKVQAKNVKSEPLASCKRKIEEKSIFSFKVGLSRETRDDFDGVLQGSKKKGVRKSFQIEPRKIWFPEKDSADMIKPAGDGGKALPTSEKAPLHVNRMKKFRGCLQNNGNVVEPKKAEQEKDLHGLPVTNLSKRNGSPVTTKADHGWHVNSPALTESADEQEDLTNPSLNIMEDPRDFHSPTLQMKTPMRNSSPCSTPRTDGMEQGFCSPAAAETIFNLGAIHCFRTLPTPKRDCYGSKMHSASFYDAEEFIKCKGTVPINFASELSLSNFQYDAEEFMFCPTKKSVPTAEEADARNESSKSSSEGKENDGSKEVSPIDEGSNSSRERDTCSPEIVATEAPKFKLRPAKRLRSNDGSKFNEYDPAPLFPTGNKGNTEFQLSEDQEDGFSRAISLFSLALERMKSKMETETSKKSSDIAISVAEGIRFQLQNAQSQMQKDVGKLTSLSKLKRKRLEARFQEQQKQLKLIHEKFKDEINQHIQDCRSSLEGLEEHQIELKKNVERQKASHDKLLLQVEEAIEIQLKDAQQRITAIHKMARQKMLQLNDALGERLKDAFSV